MVTFQASTALVAFAAFCFAASAMTSPAAAQGVIGTVQGTIEGDPSLTPSVNGGLAPGGDDAGAESGISVAPLDPLETGTAAQPIESLPGVRVTLRGLDKMTGDVETLEAAVGDEIRFHRLRIGVEACFVRVGDRRPDASAFLRVIDDKAVQVQAELAAAAEATGQPAQDEGPPPTAFSGWMFSASPALSALDHPRYDVWVLSCAIS